MSIEVMVNVLHNSKAPARAKLILLGIANHQGENGAYPSIATLAKYANCSDRTVKRDLKVLQEMGELLVENQAAPVDNQYRPNLYWVTLSGVTDSAGVSSEVSRGVQSGKSGVTVSGTLNINKTLKNKREGERLPEDFSPTQKSWDIMAEHFPQVDLKLETHSFKDYWFSATGTNATKKDWDAAWRNWIRNSYKRAKPKRSYSESDDARREREIRELLANDE
jgi:hypothetical protein